jgi:hypothetical protein
MGDVVGSGPMRWTPVDDAQVVPTRAWIEYESGRHVELVLSGPLPAADYPDEVGEGVHRVWMASPADGEEAWVGPGDHVRLDALGAGQQVVFNKVWAIPVGEERP